MADETPKTPIRTVQVSDAAKAKVVDLQRSYRLKFGEEISKAAVAEAAILAANVEDLPEPKPEQTASLAS
jgi:hypothetical protein